MPLGVDLCPRAEVLHKEHRSPRGASGAAQTSRLMALADPSAVWIHSPRSLIAQRLVSSTGGGPAVPKLSCALPLLRELYRELLVLIRWYGEKSWATIEVFRSCRPARAFPHRPSQPAW